MLKQIRELLRGHGPDIGALSARLDGQLSPERERAVDAHIAGCAACAAMLEELRLTAAMVRAMPEAGATRSFRLRASDIAAPAPATGYGGGLMRWAPAVSGAAILVLVVAIGFDRVADDGSGGDGNSLAAAREAERPTGMLEADDGASSQSGEAGPSAGSADAEPDRAAPSAEGSGPPIDTPVPAAATGGTGVAADSAADAPTTTFENRTESQAGDGTSAAESFAPPDTDTTPATGMVPAPTMPEEQIEDALQEEGDGNRRGFLIVEVTAGIVALAAAAGYVAWRITRGGVAG